ncbi:hypothetical protein LIER_03514 [Lithospermum erythrorhizon]|uniref:Uncharacterized protein n=1 Tax=Lithospermum erythrorhizon TaxID=34254 RepID=A0AAV3NXC1_LITER
MLTLPWIKLNGPAIGNNFNPDLGRDQWIISVKTKNNIKIVHGSELPSSRSYYLHNPYQILNEDQNNSISKSFVEAFFTGVLLIKNQTRGCSGDNVIITDGLFTQVGNRCFPRLKNLKD